MSMGEPWPYALASCGLGEDTLSIGRTSRPRLVRATFRRFRFASPSAIEIRGSTA